MLYSVTKQEQKQQQQQQHVYDYILTKPLVTGVYKHQVTKSFSSNDNSIAADVNPTHSSFTNNSVETDEEIGSEYEVMESQSRQVKTNDITMTTNPAYVETEFN